MNSKDAEGDIVVGYLQRYDGPNAIVDLERTDVLRAEALLPASQIPQTHRYNRGEAIRCLILDVKNEVAGEQIVVSRTHPDLITMLCEQEIPEVYEGQVRVMAVAREPGYRAKSRCRSNRRRYRCSRDMCRCQR